MKRLTMPTLTSLVFLALGGCGSDNVVGGSSHDQTCVPDSNYTYSFDCDTGTELPSGLAYNLTETSGLTATTGYQTGKNGQALAIDVTAAAGEKKLYLVDSAHSQIQSMSFWIQVSQEAFDAGVITAKLYAKTTSDWTWNAGDDVALQPNQWVQVTWLPGTEAISLADVKEAGIQLYANGSSTAASGVKILVDDVVIK